MKEYMGYGLPECLEQSIQNYKDNRETSLWDCYYCDPQSDINVAETEEFITSEQAWYLREKYLGLNRQQNYGDSISNET